MKKIKYIILCICMLTFISACASDTPDTQTDTQKKTTQTNTTLDLKNQKVLIAYFTRAENIPLQGNEDATTSASLVKKDGEIVGNTGYVAHVIHDVTKGTLFPIKLDEPYSADYDILEDLAKQQGEENARPKVSTIIENINDYDIIFLGYPNWWYDMPMGVCSFLEQVDLSDKTIIPFVTHGGSGFSDTIDTLKTMFPDANIQNEFEIYQHDVIEKEDDIITWLNSL